MSPSHGTRSGCGSEQTHWANALKQPAVAATGMLGTPGTYDELPYFSPIGTTSQWVRRHADYRRWCSAGDVSESRSFIAFWLDEADGSWAAMAVNVWDVLDDIKALIRGRRSCRHRPPSR